jgi:NTE family protein
MENEDRDKKLESRPKVGVVVASGGIKAISSIALFEFLEEAKIEPDLLVSCSGGSIFTGWWATRQSAAYLREHVEDLWTRELFGIADYRTLLSIPGLPFGRVDKTSGLLKPDLVHAAYNNVVGDQMMEDLKIRTIFQATELFTGEPVLIKTGLVREAIYASGALFPILPPICLEGQWLIDGAYSSPLPIMEAVNEGMDVIIALIFEESTTKESKGFVTYYMRCLQYMMNSLTRDQIALAVDLHHHEIIFVNVTFDRYVGLKATHRIPQILEAGEKAVEEKKEEILKAIKSFKPTSA